MDLTLVTTVVGTLCGVIALLYKRETARADRAEEELRETQKFQRGDMTQMINWYARATMDYARIIRIELPHDAMPSSSEETTQIIKSAGSKRPPKK